jgi:hypothetical protein
MENNKCQEIIEKYIQWLKEEISVLPLGEDVCEITTPFLDRYNDYLQVYMTEKDGVLTFSDGGYSLSELETSGIDLVGRKRDIFEEILRSFGIILENRQLTVTASPDDAPQRKHDLVQAMLAINDMYVLARPSTVRIFKQEVENFFDEKDIRFSTNIRLIGKSGFNHQFDFIIPHSRLRPDRVLRALSHPDKNTASPYIWQVSDVRNARKDELEAIAVMNDHDFKIKPEIELAFKHYDIFPFRWTQRERLVGKLID